MAQALPPLRFVRSVLKSFMAESGLEPRLLGANHLRITNAVHGRVDFELDVTKDHTNRLGILHGGTIASMVDLGGSLAVASTGLYATGVSTDLNGKPPPLIMSYPRCYFTMPSSCSSGIENLYESTVTYLNGGGTAGAKITATAVFGRTLAYTSVTFQNRKGEIAARGSHTKYVMQAVRAQGSPFVVPEGAEIADEEE
ncbi:Thioesterase/thiol ester dehydrase-isomerase [Xylaria grammica]|nr:Thioesterase/thiol ester dehydrase-isomerase [Xylaria grammica]